MCRYLLAQRIALPSTLCTAAAACCCPLFNYLLIFRYDMGMDGAAYANALSQWTGSLLLLLYCFWRDFSMAGERQATWPGLMLKAAVETKALLVYLSYGAAAAAMICLEW